MRSSSILVKLVTLASVIGIAVATDGGPVVIVDCTNCDACCKPNLQCINTGTMGSRGYTCMPVGGGTSLGAVTTTTPVPTTTCTATGGCKSKELEQSTTEIPKTTCSSCKTTYGPPLATSTMQGTFTTRPAGLSKNSTLSAPSTFNPGNGTAIATGGSGGGTAILSGTTKIGTPTGGSGSGSGSGTTGGAGGGAGTTTAPAATTSPAGSTGGAGRNGGSAFAAVVLGSLVWFLG